MGIPSDEELVEKYKQEGALQFLGELYTRYAAMVYGVCLKYLKDREESKDGTMQIFEKLVTSLKEHNVTNFKSWLYVLTRNHCLMILRARKRKKTTDFDPEFMENQLHAHLEVELDLIEENVPNLGPCIEQLAVEQKQCIELFFLEQKCYKEIIVITGYSDKQVKSYIQNGRRNLRICLERNASSSKRY